MPQALKNLKYTDDQINDVIGYAVGHASLRGCPHLNEEFLQSKGMNTELVNKIENSLAGAFDINFVFNRWTLGDDYSGKHIKTFSTRN